MLDGRRVLVVGASRGIGREVAATCARQGAAVVAAARSADQLTSLTDELGVVAVRCDARDDASCRSAVAEAVEALGGLDALVYAAGITAYAPIADFTRETWQDVFDTNVFGAHSVMSAAVDHLEAAAGHAIFLNSESALWEPTPWPGIGVYLASKRALESLTRSFAVERPAVAITTHYVGATITDIDGNGVEPFVDGWVQRGFLETTNVLLPEDHANAIVAVLTLGSRVRVDQIGLLPRHLPGATVEV